MKFSNAPMYLSVIFPEPNFSLVGGSDNYGKVVLSVDGTDGVICKTGLSSNTPDVICRELGFHSGYDMM